MEKLLKYLILPFLFTLPVSLHLIGESKSKHPKYSQYLKHYNQYNDYYNRGDHSKAISELKKALMLGKGIFGERSTEVEQIYHKLGSSFVNTGNYDKAKRYFNEAIRIQLVIYNKNIHINTANRMNKLGLVYYNKGRYNDAIFCYKKSLEVFLKKFGKTHTSIGVMYINLGRAYDFLKRHNTAIDYFKKSVQIFQARPQASNYTAMAYINIGYSYNSIGKYLISADFYNKALGIYIKLNGYQNQTVSDTYIRIGRAFYTAGLYSRAIDSYNKALEINVKIYGAEHINTATVQIYIAEVLRAKGDYEKALHNLKDAVKTYRIKLQKDHTYFAFAYSNLGEIYRAKGDYIRSIEYHTKALNIYMKNRNTNVASRIQIGTAYNYIGGTYKSSGDYPKAMEVFKKALKIYSDNLHKQHSYIGTAHTNIGGTYELMGEYDKAIKNYDKALKIYLNNFEADHPFIATVYNNLGLCHMYLRSFKRVLKYYKKALAIYRKRLGNLHPHVAYTYANLGYAYKGIKQFESALKYLKKSLEILKMSGERDMFIKVLVDMATVYIERGESNRGIEILKIAVKKILKYRIQIGRVKTGFTTRYIDIFNTLISLELKRKNYTGAFTADSMKRGLSISEDISLKNALIKGDVPGQDSSLLISYSNSLYELMSRRSEFINSGLHKQVDGILEKIWETETKIDELDTKLINTFPEYALLRSPKPPSIDMIKAELKSDEALISFSFIKNKCIAFVITRKRGLIVVNIGSSKTGVSSISSDARNLHTLLKNSLSTQKYKIIQSDKGQKILWNEKTDKELYSVRGGEVFINTKKPLLALRMETHARGFTVTKKKIGDIQKTIDHKEAAEIREKLQSKIFSSVLKPVLSRIDKVKKLIIIPDGLLYYIPFGILKNSSGEILYNSMKFNLMHSATVWYRIRKSSGKRGTIPLLAIGNAVYGKDHSGSSTRVYKNVKRLSSGGLLKGQNRKGFGKYLEDSVKLNNLPGTAYEVDSIAKIAYSKMKDKNKHVYTGVDASEDIIFNLKSRKILSKYRIIHFAAHGLIADDASLNAIVLTMPHVAEKHKIEDYKIYVSQYGRMKRDGFLRLGEIKSLNINADLVVMSACETSIGHEAAGEGMVGLPQAFLIAGSKAVVASLWPVDDEATSFLMEEFYKNIFKKKMLPIEALRKAQLSLRREFKDPYYWATFVLYGE